MQVLHYKSVEKRQFGEPDGILEHVAQSDTSHVVSLSLAYFVSVKKKQEYCGYGLLTL